MTQALPAPGEVIRLAGECLTAGGAPAKMAGDCLLIAPAPRPRSKKKARETHAARCTLSVERCYWYEHAVTECKPEFRSWLPDPSAVARATAGAVSAAIRTAWPELDAC
jgi:hypothetical protein